jgi:DNA-binding transcriptional LysR family regulator
LRSGAIDVAVALCPEVAGEVSYQPIRSEPVIALLARAHPLAGRQTLNLRALAQERFPFVPRDLAPRLYDVMVGLCRHASFEPVATGESFHSGWELQTLSELDVVALVPASVGPELPHGIAAVPVADPTNQLETSIIWRKDDPSPTGIAFRETAQAVFQSAAPHTDSLRF